MWTLRQVAGSALLLLVGIAPVAPAEELIGRTEIRPELHITGISKYEGRSGKSYNHDVAAITAGLTLYPHARPYYGGVFIDQRFSLDGSKDPGRNLGAYFRYNTARWDATSWLFVNQSPQSPDTWLYAARLRYRVFDGHKLGMEAAAPVNDANTPDLMLGYYRSVSESLSLNFLIGAGSSGQPARKARLELSWQIR